MANPWKLNEAGIELLNKADKVAREVIAPMAAETDEKAAFPRKAIDAMKKEGLLALVSDKKVDGHGQGLRAGVAYSHGPRIRCPLRVHRQSSVRHARVLRNQRGQDRGRTGAGPSSCCLSKKRRWQMKTAEKTRRSTPMATQGSEVPLSLSPSGKITWARVDRLAIVLLWIIWADKRNQATS